MLYLIQTLDLRVRIEENRTALRRFWNDKDKFFGYSDKRNIDCFKKLIIDECFLDQHLPDAPEYRERIETLFREVERGQVNFESFFERLEWLPYNISRLLKLFESGTLPERETAKFLMAFKASKHCGDKTNDYSLRRK